MGTYAHPAEQPPGGFMARWWQAGIILGLGTLVLGIIVAVNPTGSLNLLAVLLGVLLLISGVFNLARAFDTDERNRVWLGIAGVVFIVFGIILLLHLNLTKALIGLFIGITWIVQGLVALISALSSGRRGRGWWIAFGVISLAAGIVVAATPLSSLTALAVLLGVLFIVMGTFEIIGALIIRHGLRISARPPRGGTSAA